MEVAVDGKAWRNEVWWWQQGLCEGEDEKGGWHERTEKGLSISFLATIEVESFFYINFFNFDLGRLFRMLLKMLRQAIAKLGKLNIT
jgi:hypothetical protein